MNMITVLYTPCKNKQNAEHISFLLLEKKLVACTNIFPILSFYWWECNITNDNEYVVVAKTIQEKAIDVVKAIEEAHSYDVPCILQGDFKVNDAYFKWIKKELA